MSSIKSTSSSSNRSFSKSSSGNSSNNSDETDIDKGKQDECIRNRTNFSNVKSYHMVDKKDFSPELLKQYIESDASPKLKLLLKKIKKLDEQDMKTSGKLYKHLIFTDVNRSAYGAKIITSALIANEMNLIYHPQGKGFTIYSNEKLLETKNNNFAVLLSKSFYDRPINIKMRKTILERFNNRPDNINGELIRFIILDQGFKEGIDLFDVKYVHLFEPLTVNADEKQAIGRATRFCGQKGLEFHPRYGWPLYVFKYDIKIPEENQENYSNAKNLFELYLKYSNIDMRKVIFASELENATIEGAVDYDLTRPIHTFTIEKPDDILQSSISGGSGSKAPKSIMNKKEMRKYIINNFSQNKYPKVKLENHCSGGYIGGSPNIVQFTPTQDFIRHYFQPESAYKGLLLYHSVGTGKTCSAIATATTSFDLQGYTIIWVTRHTLKADIWKNMYNQVCNIQIQEDIKNNKSSIPKVIRGNLRYVSKNWTEPISYKQFSNMLLKKNKIYNQIVARNGEADPLRKTLLIIDEAHKIYSQNVASSEKPNTDILEKMIQNSYDVSGKDSVRVLLMTATPFTEDGMEMIKLLNLLKQRDHLPIDFQKFTTKFLDNNGYFTDDGLKIFQDKISGYISYLNRSQDARNFAHPVIQNVYAPMSFENSRDKELKIKIKVLKDEIKELKDNEDDSDLIENKLAELKKYKKDVFKSKYDESILETREKLKIVREEKKVLTSTKKIYKSCLKDVKSKYKALETNATNEKKSNVETCKKLQPKEFKICKKEALDKWNNTKSILDNKKQINENECNKLYDLNAIEKNKETIKEYRGFIKEVQEKKRDAKKIVVELNNMSKVLKSNIAEKNIIINDLNDTILQEIKIIKKDKDTLARAKKLKEYRKTNIITKKIKEVKKEIKEMRDKIRNNNTRVKEAKLSDGRMKLSKISQQYALSKYCKI